MTIVDCVIEIPTGSTNKYEIKNNILYLDRIVNQKYPANYGYIEHTLAPDGDALDIFVITKQAISPTTRVRAEILGMIPMIDGDKQDDKMIAIVRGSSIADNYFHKKVTEIVNFLKTYKKNSIVSNFKPDISLAKHTIRDSMIKNFRKIT